MKREEYKDQFRRISQKIFELAGDYDAEVLFNSQSSALTRFANNTIHQNVAVDDGGVNIRLKKGKRTGSMSVGLFLDDDALKKAVSTAKKIVDNSPEDNELMDMVGKQEYRQTHGFDEKTAGIDPDERAKIVSDAIKASENDDFDAAGIVENSATNLGIANSKGLWAWWNGTKFKFSLTPEGASGTGWAQSQGWSIDIIDPATDIVKAIDIAKLNRNPRDIEPGAYTVVLTPAAVGDILMFMAIYGFNARMHLEGRSFLTGKLGQKIFSDKLTIVDDAYDKNWAGIPFDFDGLPRQRVELVKTGVLQNLVYDRWTAKKMSAECTGHGLQQPNQWGAIPLNIVLAPGDTSMDEMIKSVKRGLLITHFHYTNVAELTKLTLTGMTRDGLFMIENGEIVYPVKNLRFTQSTIDALSKIAAVGNKQKLVSGFFFGGALTPGMIIEDFNFSSGTGF